MNLFHLPSTFKALQRKGSKIHSLRKIPSDSAKSGNSLPKPVSLHFPPVSPWLASSNHCAIQACIWMRSLTMISTWACVWQISTHIWASFSPNAWSFIPTEQGSTTVLSFFFSPCPTTVAFLLHFPLFQFTLELTARHGATVKSSWALPTLKRLTEEEKLAEPWHWAEPEK